jgi:hypothetical protein
MTFTSPFRFMLWYYSLNLDLHYNTFSVACVWLSRYRCTQTIIKWYIRGNCIAGIQVKSSTFNLRLRLRVNCVPQTRFISCFHPGQDNALDVRPFHFGTTLLDSLASNYWKTTTRCENITSG